MKTAIFGAGANGRLFFEGMTLAGVLVDCFIDQYSPQKTLCGRPVFRPDEIKDKGDFQVVSAVFPPSMAKPSSQNLSTPEDILRGLGFFRIVGFAEALCNYPEIMKGYFSRNYLWMRSTPEAMCNLAAIERLYSLLADSKSNNIVERWVNWRTTQSVEHYIIPDGQCEYFPKDIDGQLFPSSALNFVDCGSYTGDTIQDLYALWSGSINSICCFEPDVENVGKLHSTLARIQKDNCHTQSYLYPCGVSDSTRVATFSSGHGSSSAVVCGQECDSGEVLVPLVSLDETLCFAKPNYIKMDIEGAELAALHGARDILVEHAPALAICLYHRPEDLWEIPLYVNKIQPDYKMYIRIHDHLGLSAVLYCCL